jgi:hypothetical protein
MTIQFLKNYIPRDYSYQPTTETAVYNNRTYTVYGKLNESLRFDQRSYQTAGTISDLFQKKSFCQDSEYSAKAIFVYSRDFLLEASKSAILFALCYAHEDFKSDKEFILEAVKKNDQALLYAHEDLKNDKKFILEAVRQNGFALQYVCEDLKRDKEVVLEAVKQNGQALLYAHKNLQYDREAVVEAIKENGMALQYAYENFKKDRAVVLEAVKQNGLAVQYAHEDLKRDKSFVASAVKCNACVLQFVDLRQDRDFILKIIKESPQALKYAAQNLKKDRDFILEAIQQNPSTLSYADEEVQQDRNFVLEVIEKNVHALEFLNSHLKKDQAFFLKAIQKNINALHYAHQKLKQNKDFAIKAIKCNVKAMQFMHEDLTQDREFILKAVKCTIHALQFAHEDLKKDKNFVLAVAKEDVHALQYAYEDLKEDKEFILDAVEQNGLALSFAHESLQQNREVVLKALQKTPNTWLLVHKNLKKDREFILRVVKENVNTLQFMDENLKKDKDFILEVVKDNVHILRFASDNLKQNKEFVLEAVKQDGLAMLYVNDEDPVIIEAAQHSLSNKLDLYLENPDQATPLFVYASFIVDKPGIFFLHEEHPLLQKAIEAYCLTSPNNDPKNPYRIYQNLREIIRKEPLIEGFEGFRKRAEKKGFTFADIPDEIISLQTLFERIEQRGINEREVAELCCGASLQAIKENVLGENKVIPLLLAHKGKRDEPLPLTVMYLYSILKCISNADDTREGNCLSPRENQLLKFASMVKECHTGQADAIEQYYINTIGAGAVNSSQGKIEASIDQAMQIALKKALSSEALLMELMGKEPKQQSHQTLYLQNRYHKQIGLIHTLRFDRHTGVIDSTLIEKTPQETLEIIKRHLQSVQVVKQIVDQALIGSQGFKITYMEFMAYFEKEFGLAVSDYEQYIEFDEAMNPIGVTPFAIEKILYRLEYINH